MNVSNSTESTTQDSRNRIVSPNDFKISVSDHDDNDRKELISSLGARPSTDKLTLYIRQTKDPKEVKERTNANKTDIDQDNIETPPAVRRVFTPTPVDKREPVVPSPCRRLNGRPKDKEVLSPDEPDNNNVLGDGQFDRFSATRRTRRYKRSSENADASSPELVAETHIVKSPIPCLETSTSICMETEAEKETRLKAWQDRLKTPPTRRNRHQTGINRDEVKQALQLSISPPINIPSPKNNGNLMNINKIELRKGREHDNDEGFEESQSLMSESPSQGASSGGDIADSTLVTGAYSKPKLMRTSLDSKVATKINQTPSTKKLLIKPMLSNRLQPSPQKYNRSLERANSVRQQPISKDVSRSSVIPRRFGSLRKTDSQINTISKKNVERSNSRNSLVSSRSSLNSATSTNTVKRIPLKPANTNTNSKISSNIRMATATNKNILLKRTPSTSIAPQKPPRPQLSSFMKPTAASTTKTNAQSNLPSRIQTPSYRSKH